MSTTYTPTDAKRATALEFDDGDAPQASTINPLAEAAFDTATFAANRVGVEHLVNVLTVEIGTGALGTTTDNTFGDHGNYQVVTSMPVTAGDYIEITGFVHLATNYVGANDAKVRLAYQIDSGSITGATCFSICGQLKSTDGDQCVPVACHFTVASTGNLNVYLQIATQTTGSPTLTIEGPAFIRTKQSRTN